MNVNAPDFEGYAGSEVSAVLMIKAVNKKLGNQDEADGWQLLKQLMQGISASCRFLMISAEKLPI